MRCHSSLDLVSSIYGGSKYLAWWQMSDGNYDMMRVCDSMVRLVTHSSMLKNDNLCLKVMPLSACLCYQCDQADPDDVRHPVLQCPPHKHANVGPTMGQCWANHLPTIGATLGQRTNVHLPQHRANVGDIMPTSFQHWANVGQRLACQPYFWQLDNHRNAIFRICQRWPDVGAGGH